MFEFYIFEYEWRSFLLQISVDPGIQVLLGYIEETIENNIASYPPAWLSPYPSRLKLPSVGSLSINTRTGNIPVIRGVCLIPTRYLAFIFVFYFILCMVWLKTILVIDVEHDYSTREAVQNEQVCGFFLIVDSYSAKIRLICTVPIKS